MLTRTLLVLGTTGVAAFGLPPANHQVGIRLSTVLTTFLADSGVRTRGLPWTTGSNLPIRWSTPRPVATTDPQARAAGFALTRVGTVRINVGTHRPVDLSLTLQGTNAGLQRVTVGLALTDFDELKKEELRTALAKEGMLLTPLKCDEKKEGYSYGNLVFVAGAPGKTPSGLHESWNCAQSACDWAMAILYRRNDVASIACSSG